MVAMDRALVGGLRQRFPTSGIHTTGREERRRARDARRATEAVLATQAVMDGSAILVDAYALNKPGFRFGDRSASEQAYQDGVRALCDAWRQDAGLNEGQPTRAVPAAPPGAYAPVGCGLVEGDEVTVDGAPARLVRRGDWLFAEPVRLGPTRSSAPANRDSRTAGMNDAQASAYNSYLHDLENAWKTA
jgi:hypothetical protein